MFFLPVLLGCASMETENCSALDLQSGEAFAGQVECEEMLPVGAEGVVGDLMLANAQAYLILRVDPASKYFLHVGGGSLIDMAIWQGPEVLAELVPLADGGWIRGGQLTWGVDEAGAWAEVEGSSEPLPFIAGESKASLRVRYRLDLDSVTLQLEGSEAMLFMGEAGGFLGEDGAWQKDQVLLDLSPVEEDLGGAILSAATQIELTEATLIVEAVPGEPLFWSPVGAARVDLEARAFPSRDSRLDAETAQRVSADDGASLTLLGALDEVGVPREISEATSRVLAASEARAPGMGRVLAWPFSAKSHRPAHGAVPWEGLSATEVLAVAKGEAAGRRAMVDIDWMLAAGEVSGWDPLPDLVWLSNIDDFHALRAIWEEGLALGSVGPVTWVPVEDEEALPSLAALERPLIQQRSSTGSGPVLFADRQATEDLRWDAVQISVQAKTPERLEVLRVWSAHQLLFEEVLEGELQASVFVPAHLDVWVSAEGEDWALSSVLQRTQASPPGLSDVLSWGVNPALGGNSP